MALTVGHLGLAVQQVFAGAGGVLPRTGRGLDVRDDGAQVVQSPEDLGVLLRHGRVGTLVALGERERETERNIFVNIYANESLLNFWESIVIITPLALFTFARLK